MGTAPGNNAPTKSLQTLSGINKSLVDFQGNTVLLNFWASWCQPCIAEMGDLDRLARKLKDRKFKVVAVAVNDHINQVKELQKRLQLKQIEILLDPQGKLSRAYKVSAFPESFIIDPTGKIKIFHDPYDGIPKTRLVGPRAWSEDTYLHAIQKIL